MRAATPPTGVKKFKRLQNLPPPSSAHLEPCFYLQNKPHSLRDPAPSADFKPCPFRNLQSRSV